MNLGAMHADLVTEFGSEDDKLLEQLYRSGAVAPLWLTLSGRASRASGCVTSRVIRFSAEEDRVSVVYRVRQAESRAQGLIKPREVKP
jgi:hypothetical protein